VQQHHLAVMTMLLVEMLPNQDHYWYHQLEVNQYENRNQTHPLLKMKKIDS
jgi:hypothetical protein